jgi:hypothetical protein
VEDIKELLNVVGAVLKDKSKASELLPYNPKNDKGLYSEHYYWQLEDTKEMLEKVVEQHDSRVLSGSSYYRYEVSQ